MAMWQSFCGERETDKPRCTRKQWGGSLFFGIQLVCAANRCDKAQDIDNEVA